MGHVDFDFNMTSRTAAVTGGGPGLEGWAGPHDARLSRDKKALIFTWSADGLWSEREHRPEPGMLSDFLALGNAQPHTFGEYADRWGALGLDKDGQPQGWGARPVRE